MITGYVVNEELIKSWVMFLGEAEEEYWGQLRGNQEKHRGKTFQGR